MKCKKCGVELDKTAKFCPQCGETIKRYCTDCGNEVDLSVKFCPYCGRLADNMTVKETNKSERSEDKFVTKKDRTEQSGIKGSNGSDDETPIWIYFIVVVIMAVVFFTQFDSFKEWVGTITKPKSVPTLRDNVQSPYGEIEDKFQKIAESWGEFCNVESLGYEEYDQEGYLDTFAP